MKIRYSLLIVATILLSSTSISQSVSYCIPTYNNPCFNPWTTNDMIDNFWTTGGLTDISNLSSGCATSANNNYSDFTNIFLVTIPGANIGLNIQGAVNGSNGTCIGGSGGCFAQGFAIWIDWNQDGDFVDPGEKVFESPSAGHQVFTGSFTVPPNIQCGDYRMRARAVYATGGATITSCGNHSYGEVEDYTINVTNCSNQERTICLGNSAAIDYSTMLPPNVSSVVVTPPTNVTVTIPIISFAPIDTTFYQLTWTSPDSSWIDSAFIYVNTPLQPTNAGLDDTTCTNEFLQLNGTLGNTTTTFGWSVAPSPGSNNLAFIPNNQTLNPQLVGNSSGHFAIVLTEMDTNGVCPNVTDTANVIYSTEFHTIVFTDPTCYQFSDGTITINSTGTLGASEYSIDNGGTWSTSNAFTGLTAGVYDVISKDVAGCTYTSQITLTDPDKILISTSSDTTVCENGSATLIGTSPNATFFNWDFTPSLAATQIISPLTDSTVTVYATNLVGCSSDTLTINVNMYDPISISITPNDTICPGNPTTIEVVATGGHQGYDYAWQAGGNGTNWATSVLNLTPNKQTQYCVSVTDGCESTPKIICTDIIMRPVPSTLFTSAIIENCEPEAEVRFDITTPDYLFDIATISIYGRTYVLKNDLNNPSSKSLTVPIQTAGTYDFYLKIESIYDCINDTTAYQHVTIDPIPEANFYITPETATIFQPVFQIINLSEGSNNTYTWDLPGGNPPSSNAINPEVRYPDGVPGKYPINLTVVSDKGCVNTDNGNAVVLNDIVIYAPNSFTPNGDSHNDTWKVFIEGINEYDYHLQVFNRWGEIVFESFDPQSEWDGTLVNGTTILPGTYAWLIKAKDVSTSEVFDFRGTINIFR